ncbi:MAG: hypothetical protein EXQ81_12205 [Thermoleophilia bacterium]|nr:hypothetical protein [Thermoleophilia bacterium]
MTIFSIPKPFIGKTAENQQTAVTSWCQLAPDVQVVLVGDDVGVAETARSAGAQHVGGVECSSRGTPYIDDAFSRVAEIAEHSLGCFVNGDIVLLDDLVSAIRSSASVGPEFLLVGQNRDLPGVDQSDLGTPDSLAHLRRRAVREGVLRGPTAIDYFVFSVGLFDPMPRFAVGRAGFDNWMIWKARQLGPVVDLTDAVVAIHQSHGYGHLDGGKAEAYAGEEAARNIDLAGGRRRIYTLHDASHRMRADGSIVRNYGSILRSRETARKIAWKLGRR